MEPDSSMILNPPTPAIGARIHITTTNVTERQHVAMYFMVLTHRGKADTPLLRLRAVYAAQTAQANRANILLSPYKLYQEYTWVLTVRLAR
jgi:hypothetical protein